MLEDPPLKVVQLGPGLEPQLIDEALAGRLEGVKCIGLSPGAIKRDHQRAEETLSQRMLSHEPLELGDQRRSSAERELRFDPRLQNAQPQLVESLGLGADRWVVEHVAPRRSAPQRERLAQRAGGGVMVAGLRCAAGGRRQLFEPIGVKLARLHTEQVAAGLAQQPVMAEQLPQPIKVGVQRIAGARWRPLPPQRIDQLIAGSDLVCVQQQHREQRPLLAPPERKRARIDGNLEWSEHRKPHTCTMKPPKWLVCQFFASPCRHDPGRWSPIDPQGGRHVEPS